MKEAACIQAASLIFSANSALISSAFIYESNSRIHYTIGGYQVIKKWFSYCEHKLLNRPLTTDEAREVRNIARRIAAILLLQPSLDANYQSIKAATYPLPSS